jgi:hypothetical protein
MPFFPTDYRKTNVNLIIQVDNFFFWNPKYILNYFPKLPRKFYLICWQKINMISHAACFYFQDFAKVAGCEKRYMYI